MSYFAKRSKHPAVIDGRRALTLESLESRQMLTGNVMAYVVGRDLFVFGDDQTNGLEVAQTGPSTYQLTGLAGIALDEVQEPTTINGILDVPQTLTATGKLYFYMRGGDDLVRVGSLQTATDIFFDMGAGGDILQLGVGINDSSDFELQPPGPIRARTLSVQSGSGNDRVLLQAAEVDRLTANLGVGVDSFFAGPILARRSLVLDGGPGNQDSLWLETPPSRTPSITGIEFDVFLEATEATLQFALTADLPQTLSETSQRSFTTDFDVTLDGRGRPQVEPIQSEVTIGLSATATLDEISPDGRYVLLSIDATFIHVDDVLRQTVPIPGGLRQLQQPVVSTTTAGSSVSISDGGTVVLGGEKFGRFAADDTTAEEGVSYLTEHSSLNTGNNFEPPLPGQSRFHSDFLLVPTPQIVSADAVNLELRAIYLQEKVIPRPLWRSQADDAKQDQSSSVKLTLLDGETQTIDRQTTQPMLTSYDITTHRTGRHTVDSVITNIDTGLEFTATANVSSDRRYVQLDLDYLRTAITGVPTNSVFGPFGVASIQLPTVTETHLVSRVIVPDGGTILLGTIQDGLEVLNVFVTPRITIQEEEADGESLQSSQRGDLQVTIEVRTTRITDVESATSAKLTAVEQTTAELTHTVRERLVSDVAIATLAGGIRTVKPVVTTFERGLEATQLPVLFDDRSGVDFQVHYHETAVAKNRLGIRLTPFGLQFTRQVELATLNADFSTGIVDGETVSQGPLVDSRGRSFTLLLTGRIIFQEESDEIRPRLPNQAVLMIQRVR